MASANVKELTDGNFEAEVLRADVPTLVDFWAVWCGPCKQIAPIVDAGAVTVGSIGEQTATFSTITLQPGRYCTTLVSDGAPTLNFLLGPSFAGISASTGYTAVVEFSAAMTYGAFPTPWNISLTANYGISGGRWAVRLVP